MAKRATGVGKRRKTRSHKTAKRREAKRQMLILKNSKHRKHNRKINPERLKAGN
jgi:hypothetical protein